METPRRSRLGGIEQALLLKRDFDTRQAVLDAGLQFMDAGVGGRASLAGSVVPDGIQALFENGEPFAQNHLPLDETLDELFEVFELDENAAGPFTEPEDLVE